MRAYNIGVRYHRPAQQYARDRPSSMSSRMLVFPSVAFLGHSVTILGDDDGLAVFFASLFKAKKRSFPSDIPTFLISRVYQT